jgi:hypothetical protein
MAYPNVGGRESLSHLEAGSELEAITTSERKYFPFVDNDLIMIVIILRPNLPSRTPSDLMPSPVVCPDDDRHEMLALVA